MNRSNLVEVNGEFVLRRAAVREQPDVLKEQTTGVELEGVVKHGIIQQIDDILSECSIRLSQDFETEDLAPEISSKLESMKIVGVHFFKVAVDENEAISRKDEILTALTTLDASRILVGNPSYIGLGALLDSQEKALQLMAVGEVAGLWKVICSDTDGISNELRSKLFNNEQVAILKFNLR